jgi:hypothetical protein
MNDNLIKEAMPLCKIQIKKGGGETIRPRRHGQV